MRCGQTLPCHNMSAYHFTYLPHHVLSAWLPPSPALLGNVSRIAWRHYVTRFESQQQQPWECVVHLKQSASQSASQLSSVSVFECCALLSQHFFSLLNFIYCKLYLKRAEVPFLLAPSRKVLPWHECAGMCVCVSASVRVCRAT